MKILNLIILLILISATTAFSEKEKQDVIYFKNTNIVKGEIVEVIPGDVVRIKLANGIIYTYSMNEVLRIEFAPPPKPKILTPKDLKIESAPTPIEVTLPSKPKNPSYKSPGLAFVLSFLITGTGQFYNGDVSKGIVQIGFVTFGYAMATQNSNKRSRSSDEEFTKRAGLALMLGGAVWSLIDAPVSASKKNKEWENDNTYGHLMEFDSGSQIVGFDLGYRDKLLGGKITLHF